MREEIINLTTEQIYKIKDLGYTIEDFLYTYFSFYGDERYITVTPNLRLVSMGKLTAEGYKLMAVIENKPNSNIKLKADEKKLFEILWQTYPENNGTYNFHYTRLVRGNKEAAMSKFRTLLKEYPAMDIIEGTRLHIEKLYKASTASNQLEYLPNLSRYLEEKRFLEVSGNSLMDKLKPTDNDMELM
jgi:hypothetical protein